MSVVAEFTIPAETFGLGRLLSSEIGVRIELERLVPTGNEVMPYFWAELDDDDLETFERKLRSDPLVIELNVLDHLDGEALYAIKWTDTREPHSGDRPVRRGHPRRTGSRGSLVVHDPLSGPRTSRRVQRVPDRPRHRDTGRAGLHQG
jgi:hypothetical protein